MLLQKILKHPKHFFNPNITGIVCIKGRDQQIHSMGLYGEKPIAAGGMFGQP